MADMALDLIARDDASAVFARVAEAADRAAATLERRGTVMGSVWTLIGEQGPELFDRSGAQILPEPESPELGPEAEPPRDPHGDPAA